VTSFKDGKGVAVFASDKKINAAALRRYVKVGDPTSKRRHLLKRSPVEGFGDAVIWDCKPRKSKGACGKVHLELVRMEALRPPSVISRLKRRWTQMSSPCSS